ncbi:MAG: alcohol dehydrogenase catalytic domain-containing protein [Candidatus Omnitrophica bacterium]|nr:alcohol dehydrogenase catalytic domain-containing protein [Candidatus Omnitrophota bacterium]MBU1047730.1 alcohol dehydrogenase catalytic domain-containing protein [Candidatus Omnitrophota bacterium]MBU1631439.1 alcohol dehydrogenase catalytic domain-containing protein [Candidatus Omnitrophota bacterium]MBU1767311.1 alcohol dehydrogenase catalytic domain-containing protein [Candidatus Omnitrophota bacterium]MBU1888540.1 alcohol dehydrogenase catalytic domain-containing protein [Candidatus Om
MKAQVFYSSYHIKYEDIPVPTITDDELLIKVKICGLCGTDIYKIQQESVQSGSVLGHEVVGTIEKQGRNVGSFKVGERVFVSHHAPCFSCKYCKQGTFSLCELFKSTNIKPGGFAEFIKVPKELVKNNVIPLPDSLSDEEAVLIEPFACAWRNIKRIQIEPKDVVTIIGAGPSGIMHLILLKTMGVKSIRLVDVVDSRLEFAEKLGAEDVINIKNKKIDKFKESDIVIVSVGNKEAVEEALDMVRVGGKLSIFAQVPDNTRVQLDPNLIYHETLILGTYSSTPIEQKEVFDMFVSGKLKDATSIISHRLSLKDFQKGLKLAVEAKNSCKILFYP